MYRTTLLSILGDTITLPICHITLSELNYSSDYHHPSLVWPESFTRWRPRRQMSFIAGRLAANSAALYWGIGDIKVPRLQDGSPDWPESLIGSISHCENEAIAVVLPKALVSSDLIGLGVDVEDLSKSQYAYESIGSLAQADEFRLMQAKFSQAPLAALALFSIKESVYKAIYPTLLEYVDFLAAVVTPALQEGQFHVAVTITRNGHSKTVHLVSYCYIEASRIYAVSYWPVP